MADEAGSSESFTLLARLHSEALAEFLTRLLTDAQPAVSFNVQVDSYSRRFSCRGW
jgi:hypothetical protein